MTKSVTSFSATAIILGVLLHSGAAGANPPLSRTWVSGTSGNDANPCTRASPCATFSTAYANTAAGGEIDVLDGGDFGPLNIQHALTVGNDGAGTAAITPSGFGVYINAGSTDSVVLRGLNLNGLNSSGNGVIFAGGGSLLIDNCSIQEFHSGPGISFTGGNAAELWVTDTMLSYDGASAAGSIWIVPITGATATAHLERVQIFHSIGNGIRVDGTFGGGATDVELHDVTVDGATGGSAIVAVSQTSGGPTVKLLADHVTSSHNVGYGFRAVGETASVSLRHSTIEDNGVGVGASSGGQILSYGDNSFGNNVSGDGVAPTPIGLK